MCFQVPGNISAPDPDPCPTELPIKPVSTLEVDKQRGERKRRRKWDQEGQRGSGSTAAGKDLTKKVRFGKRLAGGGRQLGKKLTERIQGKA